MIRLLAMLARVCMATYFDTVRFSGRFKRAIEELAVNMVYPDGD